MNSAGRGMRRLSRTGGTSGLEAGPQALPYRLIQLVAKKSDSELSFVPASD